MRRGSLALGALLLWAVPGRAEVPEVAPVRLRYERGSGAERCPDERALRAEVAARLGLDPFRDDAPRTLEVRIDRTLGLRAEVALRDARGRRLGGHVLKSPGDDCIELASSLALELALVIDPLGVARAARPAPTPPPPPPEPAKAAAPRVAWKIDVGGGLLAAAGLAPSPAPGLRAMVDLRHGGFSLGLEGEADLPTSVGAGGGEVTAAPAMFGIFPCIHFGWTGACLLGQAGMLSGGSSGLSNPQAVHTGYVALGARGEVDIPLSRSVSLRPEVDVLVPLLQTTLTVGGEPAWTMAPVAGEAAVVALYRLP